MGNPWPCVPGHEIAGVVIEVGGAVTKFAVGDHAGVGTMVDSCGTCKACKGGEESSCMSQIATYGGKDKFGRASYPADGPQHTLGGYSNLFVVQQSFAIKIPAAYPLAAAGPVMCAGITVYSPLRKHGAGPGVRVGVAGVGGLGQMAIKLAVAMGATVTAFTRSPNKAAFARACGATNVVVTSNPKEMVAVKGTVDLLLDTIPSEHDWSLFASVLSKKGVHVILGLCTGLVGAMIADTLKCGGSKVKGSGTGGLQATQEVMDLCAAKNITPDIKVIPVDKVGEAFTSLSSTNESGTRFVLDISTLDDGSFARMQGSKPPTLSPHDAPLGALGIVGATVKILFGF